MQVSRVDSEMRPTPTGNRPARLNLQFTLDHLLLVMMVFSCIAIATGFWVRFFRGQGNNPIPAILFTLAAPSLLLLVVAGAQVVFRFVQRKR